MLQQTFGLKFCMLMLLSGVALLARPIEGRSVGKRALEVEADLTDQQEAELVGKLKRVCATDATDALDDQQVDATYGLLGRLFADKPALLHLVADQQADFREEAQFLPKKPVNKQPKTAKQVALYEAWLAVNGPAVAKHTGVVCGMYNTLLGVHEQFASVAS